MWKAAVGNKTDAKAKMVNDEVSTYKAKFPLVQVMLFEID